MNAGIFDVAQTTGIASSFLGATAFSTTVAPILAPTISNEPLTLEFDTTVGTAGSRQVCVSLAGAVNILVDWGDGYAEPFTTTGDKLHTYVNNGVYVVRIYGYMTAFGSSSSTVGKDKLVRCLAWGNIGITTHDNFFYNNTNLRAVPPTAPTSVVNSASSMFRSCTVFNQPLNHWDMSQCISTGAMFTSASAFNQPLNNWDMRRCGSTSNMFAGAVSFNSSLAGWNLSSNANMSSMFFNALAFDQPINDWTITTASTWSAANMFQGAAAFNQPLYDWDMSRCIALNSMFQGASAFNQPINNWTLSTTSDFAATSMFQNAAAFNQPLNNWDMSRCTSVASMFQRSTGTSTFNSSVAGWNLSRCTSLANVFNGATLFNQPINDWVLNTTSNFTATNAFTASGFNQPLNNWNMSRCTNTSYMFGLNTVFNSSLAGWNLSSCTNFGTGTINGMFRGATAFNQPINDWTLNTTSNFTAAGMFHSSGFQQSLSNWNLARCTTLADFRVSGALLTANYDATLIGWNNNKLVGANGVANWATALTPHFGTSRFTAGGAAATARAALVTYGWTITDGGSI